jgi:hypothetical protein
VNGDIGRYGLETSPNKQKLKALVKSSEHGATNARCCEHYMRVRNLHLSGHSLLCTSLSFRLSKQLHILLPHVREVESKASVPSVVGEFRQRGHCRILINTAKDIGNVFAL